MRTLARGGVRRLVLIGLLASALAGCGGGSVGTVRVPPARERFPGPPAGSIVLARELGSDALAIAVVPGGTRSVAQVSLVGPGGGGVSGRRVVVAGRPARP